MSSTTDRLSLPLLASGQAQKEITHNAALALADMLIMPVVQSVAPTTVPASPTAGQCWIVGTGATGAWAGNDGALACYTSGGWQFAPAFEGMQAWSIADGVMVRRSGGAWLSGIITADSYRINNIQVVGTQQPTIATPTGGTTTDTQARTTISAILTALKAHGLIAAS